MTARVGSALEWLEVDSGRILGSAAGLHDVTGLDDHPRSVVNSEQFMDVPSDEDVLTLVESARGEALMERRRRNLVVSREPSFFLSWAGSPTPVDCSRGSWVSQLGAALLSDPLRLRSRVRPQHQVFLN